MQNANGNLPRERFGRPHGVRNLFAGYRPQSSALNPQPSRRGFTLVELLIVITILAILATLVVGVATIASQTGREAKTRNMIARLHTLLTEHYNSFKTRRVELHPDVVSAIGGLTATASSAEMGKITAAARLFALREMMLLEMPDRWSDLVLDIAGNAPKAPAYLVERTALSNAFLRRFQALLIRNNSFTGAPNTTAEVLANQSAECLYMIIMLACGDGEARSLFNESDIGDVDGDGAPEFLDAWGHPISFIRWPPGFDSLVQLNANALGGMPPQVPSDNPLWADESSRDHDPFDMFRVQLAAYQLVPLIYSAGRDERPGINPHVDYVPWRRSFSPVAPTGSTYPYFDQPLDPYIPEPISSQYLGSDVGDGTATDNLHNHLIGGRL